MEGRFEHDDNNNILFRAIETKRYRSHTRNAVSFRKELYILCYETFSFFPRRTTDRGRVKQQHRGGNIGGDNDQGQEFIALKSAVRYTMPRKHESNSNILKKKKTIIYAFFIAHSAILLINNYQCVVLYVIISKRYLESES